MFDVAAFTLPQQLTSKENIQPDSPFHQELKNFMNESDLLCSEINTNGQFYRNGDLLVIEVEDSDTIKVGVIQTVLVRNDSVYFVTKSYLCKRHWLRYFESVDCDNVCIFTESKRIVDYKPLIKRGTSVKFNFMLHHHISFTYD